MLRNFIIQNFPFLEDDFDAITDYDLFCKMIEYVKKITLDNEKFVNEVSSNLEKMYNEGKFDSLIEEIINLQVVFTFSNVSDLQSATNLVVNSFVKTMGFYNVGDYGSAYYKIRYKTDSDVIDDIIIISLTDNDLVAELIEPSTIRPEIFGAYGDGTHDDTGAFLKMLNYVYIKHDNLWIPNKTMVCEKEYNIDSITIPSGMQYVNMVGNNKGSFKNGGFTFNSGSGYNTYIDGFNFTLCDNAFDFKYYNVEYGKITIQNCNFYSSTGTTLSIKRRSHRVFIKNNLFVNNEKSIYLEDVDMCYLENNVFETSNVWENNHTEIEQKATNEGTIFVKGNMFIPAVNQTGSNLAWIKIGNNATITHNRFSGEHEGIHPILINDDNFDSFNPSDSYMYPIVNFVDNPIVAGTGSILLNKACGQINIHNNSFTKISPCLSVIDSTIYDSLDFNKLYISIKDNTGKIFNYRNYGWARSVSDGVAPIVPLCLQKFIKRNNLFALNSNQNYESEVSGKKLTIKLNTDSLINTSHLQFLINGSINPNPGGSSSYFENFTALLTLKRAYIDGGINIYPEVKLLTENTDFDFTLTPLINGVSKITTSSDTLSDDIEISVTYSGEYNNATVNYKGFLPLELFPVNNSNVYYGNDYATNN